MLFARPARVQLRFGGWGPGSGPSAKLDVKVFVPIPNGASAINRSSIPSQLSDHFLSFPPEGGRQITFNR